MESVLNEKQLPMNKLRGRGGGGGGVSGVITLKPAVLGTFVLNRGGEGERVVTLDRFLCAIRIKLTYHLLTCNGTL